MSDKPIQVIPVGKWSVGYSKSQDVTILQFEFADHAPLNLALPRDAAEGIAKAIQDQLQQSPKAPDQMN